MQEQFFEFITLCVGENQQETKFCKISDSQLKIKILVDSNYLKFVYPFGESHLRNWIPHPVQDQHC